MLEERDWELLRALARGRPRAVTRGQPAGCVVLIAAVAVYLVSFVVTAVRLWAAWWSGSQAATDAALAAITLAGEAAVWILLGLSLALPRLARVGAAALGAAALGAAAAAGDAALAPLATEATSSTAEDAPGSLPLARLTLPWPREDPRQAREKGLLACLILLTIAGLILFLVWALALERSDPVTWDVLLAVLGSLIVLSLAGMLAVWRWTRRAHGVRVEVDALGIRWREPGVLRRRHRAAWSEFRAICRTPFDPLLPAGASAEPCVAYVAVRARHGLIWREPTNPASEEGHAHRRWLALLAARTGLPVRDVSSAFRQLRTMDAAGRWRKPETDALLRALATYLPAEGFAPLRADLTRPDRHRMVRRLGLGLALTYFVLMAGMFFLLRAQGT